MTRSVDRLFFCLLYTSRAMPNYPTELLPAPANHEKLLSRAHVLKLCTFVDEAEEFFSPKFYVKMTRRPKVMS